MKNQVLLENYHLPEDHERRIGDFIGYYNTRGYHEGRDNLTPADVNHGRDRTIL